MPDFGCGNPNPRRIFDRRKEATLKSYLLLVLLAAITASAYWSAPLPQRWKRK
jgi:hypothetical protein